MALPTSGPLSFSAIANELGTSLNNVSLRGMSNSAGFSTPDSIGEFYGYSFGSGGLIEVNWGYNSRRYLFACSASQTTFYADSSSPNTATVVYFDAEGTMPGFAGYYSDGISSREFDGTSFVGFSYLC
jgi:hypothetical protein